MMLRSDLNDSDIPHRTTMHNRIKELVEEYMNGLARDMTVHLDSFLIY